MYSLVGKCEDKSSSDQVRGEGRRERMQRERQLDFDFVFKKRKWHLPKPRIYYRMSVKDKVDMIITVGYGTWAATPRSNIEKNSIVVCDLTGKHEVSQMSQSCGWEMRIIQFVELGVLLVVFLWVFFFFFCYRIGEVHENLKWPFRKHIYLYM